MIKKKEITKTIPYRLQFIDSAKFRETSLSNFVNNYAKGIHETKCKFVHNDKKCETCGIKCKYCELFLDTRVIDDLIKYKFFFCNKNYQKKFLENLRKRFIKTCKYPNRYINKFILLLQKGEYETHMNIGIIGKNSMKLHSLKKRTFAVP